MQRSFFTQTTHKARISGVDDLLFPVETFPVSVDIKSPEGDIRLPVFKIAHNRLTALTARFTESLDHLHQCEVPPRLFAPIVRGVLALGGPNPAKKTRPADAGEWGALTAAIEAVGERYVSELGATAYAVLNTVTDLASRPPDNRYLRRDRHALQRLAGTWLNRFSVECRKPGFNAAAYASQLAIDGRSLEETE